jgi:hypothetical protein
MHHSGEDQNPDDRFDTRFLPALPNASGNAFLLAVWRFESAKKLLLPVLVPLASIFVGSFASRNVQTMLTSFESSSARSESSLELRSVLY